ncbi:MAG TPA: DUF2442 domain-containing protein [Acidobacteriaceae bacterium]
MDDVDVMDEVEAPLDARTEAQIDAFIARSVGVPPPARVTSVRFDESQDRVVILIDDGCRLEIPRSNLQCIATAPLEQVREVEPFMLGTAINWPQLDYAFPLDGLREGRYGNDQWMKILRQAREPQLQKAS